jgi:serine/threonine protein kinase
MRTNKKANWVKRVNNENVSYSYKEALVHKICNLSSFLPETFDVKIEDEDLTIRMEFLNKRLKNQNNKEQAWFDILQAVAILNFFGIAHRDIKADNIMYRNGEKAVLIDFGLSKCLIGDSHTPDVISYFYRPPELDDSLEIQNYRFEIDSWSLGIWALELFNKNFEAFDFLEEWEANEYGHYLESLPDKIKNIVATFLLPSGERKTALDWVKVDTNKFLFYYPDDYDIKVPERIKEWEKGYKSIHWSLEVKGNLREAIALWMTSILFMPHKISTKSLAKSFHVDEDDIEQKGLEWFLNWKINE